MNPTASGSGVHPQSADPAPAGNGGGSFIRPALEEPLSYEPWSAVLAAHVDPEGYVDYEGVGRNPDFRRFIGMINGARPSAMPAREQLAFWTNAYNALTFQLIIDNLEPEMGKQLGSITEIAAGPAGVGTELTSPWDLEVAEIEGVRMTLQQIEDEKVRKLGNALIHFTINCASMSCPRVMREAYEVENYQGIAERAAVDYLNDRRWNYLRDGELHLSMIFAWYREDFVKSAGSVPAYVARYWSDPAEARLIALIPPEEIRYEEYDWGLTARELP